MPTHPAAVPAASSSSSRIRVLWVVKGLGPGGAERLLVAAAQAHDTDHFELECAYVLPWKDHLVGELEAAGVRTQCLSTTRRDPRWPLRLRALIRKGHYDVVHVHSPLPGSVARLAVRTMRTSERPGVVSTEHNRWATHRLPTRLANRSTGRWDHTAIAVTDEVRDSMQGPIARRAVTLRHGIHVASTAEAVEHRAAIRAELGIAADEFVVGTVANFRPQKDYPNLLRAAKALADRNVPVRIVAVGQGPQETEIKTLRDELGLTDRVILTGFRDDAVRVMGACDGFVLASQWEGLPVAIMEALALGLPIVATDVGGMAEELHDEVDALLVPPSDHVALATAIERVSTDLDLRRRLAAASTQRAPEFDVARTVEVLERTYTDAARNSPATRPTSTQSRHAPHNTTTTTDTTTDTTTTSTTTTTNTTAARKPELHIRPATDHDRDAILDVLRRSLGSDDPRSRELFSWKHDQNPFGTSPMWVAIDSATDGNTDGDRIAGFRTFLRWEFERGGQVLHAVRAVDTATDPDYQGRGLFTSLTRHALAEMRAEGVHFVFNTPNGQSRPGYLKMGWRQVGRLPAAVHVTGPGSALTVARSKVPAERWSQELTVGVPVGNWLDEGGGARAIANRRPPTDVREIRTRVDEAFLRWRFATPLLGYRAIEGDDATVIVRARRRGDALELAVVACFGDQAEGDRLAASTARAAGADYAIRLGPPNLRCRFVPLPGGGPILTWRAVTDPGEPPLSNWSFTLGDIELF